MMMLRKIIAISLFAIALGTTILFAKSTTEVELLNILGKQQKLSSSLLSSYKKHEKHSTMITQIKTLKSGYAVLKSSIHNSEIDNLLVFLDICLDELYVTVKKPYSLENAQIVADLGASISEGNRYVSKALKKNS
jgi:hypothetical protein